LALFCPGQKPGKAEQHECKNARGHHHVD
jgi:hypothetical protein